MAKGKGWFFESRRHKLSALGIKTGRKLTKKPVSMLLGNDQKMFYPKGDSPLAETAHRPVTKDIESAVKGNKKNMKEQPLLDKSKRPVTKDIESAVKAKKVSKSNLVDYIMAYEQGQLSDSQTVKLFSHLVKTGKAWTLQGHYGRVSTNLIKQGYIDETGTILKKGTELKYPKHKSIFTSIVTVPKDILKSAKKHPTTALFGGVFLSTMAVTGRYQPAMIGATGAVAIKETIGMPKKLIAFHKRRRIEASFFKKHGRKPKKSELKKLMELNYGEIPFPEKNLLSEFRAKHKREPTKSEIEGIWKKWVSEVRLGKSVASHSNYPKENRGKKILKGALIGATVGALAYKKGKKNNPVPKGTRFAFDSVIKTGKYKGLRPRYTFKNNEVIEIAYFKGKKKVATKKLSYPDNDVTIEPTTVGGIAMEKPVATLEGAIVEAEPEKKETALQKTFRIGKATLQRGKEIGAKLKEMKEESDKAFMEREHKRLVKAQSELNLIRTRNQVRTTREAIQKERTSIFSPAKKSEEKKGKSILPRLF